jgi:hypothetical protein
MEERPEYITITDEIITMELLSILRCHLEYVMGRGWGEVVIVVTNHQVDRIDITRREKYRGVATKPLSEA